MPEADPARERSPYVVLSPLDNVVVLTRHVEPGDLVPGPSDQTWNMSAHLDAGNKLASRRIEPGEKVIKLGVAIGTATAAIAPGDHVHTHNLQSDHIPIDHEERPDDRTH